MRFAKLVLYSVILLAMIPFIGAFLQRPFSFARNDDLTPLATNRDMATVNKIRITYDYDLNWFVTVTSHVNELNIEHIIINRGNCKIAFLYGASSLKKVVGFGGSVKFAVYDCNPIEVEVQARQGNAVFNLPEF